MDASEPRFRVGSFVQFDDRQTRDEEGDSRKRESGVDVSSVGLVLGSRSGLKDEDGLDEEKDPGRVDQLS